MNVEAKHLGILSNSQTDPKSTPILSHYCFDLLWSFSFPVEGGHGLNISSPNLRGLTKRRGQGELSPALFSKVGAFVAGYHSQIVFFGTPKRHQPFWGPLTHQVISAYTLASSAPVGVEAS